MLELSLPIVHMYDGVLELYSDTTHCGAINKDFSYFGALSPSCMMAHGSSTVATLIVELKTRASVMLELFLSPV